VQYGELFGKAAIIRVEDTAVVIGHNRKVDLGIVGNAKCVLEQLAEKAEKLGPFKIEEWKDTLRKKQQERKRAWEEGWKSNERPIHPLRLVREVAEFLKGDDVVVFDGGDIKFWGKTTLKATHPGQFIDTGPFGCIGTGVPQAVAAKAAFPGKRILNLNGDGSFGINAMEFDTAVRHKLPFVSVIGNDQAWGMIMHHQRELYGRDRVVGSRLGLVRYDRVVEALGGYGELVEDPAEIKPALERAFSSGKPACLNVLTQARVSPVTEASLLMKRTSSPSKTGNANKN
jgi:acetolactate synthase-1/2/3 large subunit